jgi:hypothetical protein
MIRAARTPGSGRAYRHSEVKRRLLEELRSMERPSGTRAVALSAFASSWPED